LPNEDVPTLGYAIADFEAAWRKFDWKILLLAKRLCSLSLVGVARSSGSFARFLDREGGAMSQKPDYAPNYLANHRRSLERRDGQRSGHRHVKATLR
jgi:hypothetical protein